MVEIDDINLIKKIMFGVIKDIHSFCEKNNIKYFLFYGSLLGAVRHNGFIPWDDDIDIAMPREDYEKFIKLYGNERYGVYSCFNNKNYPYPYAKAFDKTTLKQEPVRSNANFSIGIDVDIFPYDFFAKKEVTNKIIKKRQRLIRKIRLSSMKPQKTSGFKAFLKVTISNVMQIVGMTPNALSRKLNKMANFKCRRKHNKDICAFFADPWDTELTLIDSNSLENVELHPFENTIFYIPTGYKDVLELFYGDFMTPPPVEQRITHHTYRAYWIK